MIVRFTDNQIQALIDEPKTYRPTDITPGRMTHRDAHQRASIDVTGHEGNQFVVKLRQAILNRLNFSCILGLYLPESNRVFLLRRYNGKHFHRNRLTGSHFYDFHIHSASAACQSLGYDEEHHAEVTDRYTSLAGAVDCMITDCNFVTDSPIQNSLFNL